MIYPVILCGGYGTRLWPLSRTNLPKQFIKAFEGRSLFQNTLARVSDRKIFHSPYILTNAQQRALVNEQLADDKIDEARIYLEPSPRSTAPAITIAALEIMKEDSDAVILAVSSDNVIQKPKTFVRTLEKAAEVAIKNNKFLLFSSKPTYSETGYGYIKNGHILNHMKDEVHVHEIKHFIEKPSLSETEACIKAGYQWNCGMFLLPVKQYLAEIKEHAPAIFKACVDTLAQSKSSKCKDYSWVSLNKELFNKCPEDSIDYALMEKTNNSAVVRSDLGWYDVGTWQTLYELTPKDFDGNILSGEVISINSRNSHIYSTDKNRVLAAIDVHDLTIVQSSDATLIIPRERSQDVRKIISILKERKSFNFLKDTHSYFNWGNAEVIKEDRWFKFKKVIVKPKMKHFAAGNKRNKHIIITKGTAEYQKTGQTIELKENDSLMVEAGIQYSFKNKGSTPLEFIKIESKTPLKV